MTEYIKIEPKSDDCVMRYPYPYVPNDTPLTKEELRKQYYPFFEEPIIRRIDDTKETYVSKAERTEADTEAT